MASQHAPTGGRAGTQQVVGDRAADHDRAAVAEPDAGLVSHESDTTAA